ncbi:MAG TPA: SufD family Fe-S cluster assembly protein, partial [Euzebya sp.]|nr:SufD family Fe-S cluster assembly protein [Euzebya sp.]
FKAFSDLQWPTHRDEDWRFTDPRRIELGRDLAPATTTASGPAGQMPAGVVVTDMATAARDHADVVQAHLGTVVPPDEKFAALALSAFDGGAFVHVGPGVELDQPITIDVQAVPGTQVRWVLIVVERQAKATVLLTQSGAADASTGTGTSTGSGTFGASTGSGTSGASTGSGTFGATVVDVVEAVVGDGATLNLVTTQDWGAGVAHVTTHRGRVGRDATYQQTEVTLGGQTVYVRPDVWLDGRGGSAELLGVYFPTGTEKVEHRSLIFHDADHTTSNYVHKGALSDEGHATWYGNIRIDKDAKQTVSDETNRNLILSPGARADTLPFLEIETADVTACGHHSSVGQVDEVQLWYLQSRGISREDAARMLVFAFFAEVLERINAPGVAERVLADIEVAVQHAPATLMDPRRTAGARSGQRTAAGAA